MQTGRNDEACLPGSLAGRLVPECPPGTGRVHIVQRGHDREPCFFAEEDYSSYLHWLGKALDEAECALHAYVLINKSSVALWPPLIIKRTTLGKQTI